MNKPNVDLTAGFVLKMPTHEYGTVNGFDSATGLPIVKRKQQPTADTQAKPMQPDATTAKPETKPANPETKPAAVETQPSKPDTKPAKDETAAKPDLETKPDPKPAAPAKLEKGAPVMVSGKSGKIIYIHDKMRIARVHFDSGDTRTVNLKDLQPSTEHVAVQAHYRKLPEK